jgi:hypothetical protein
MRRLPGCVWQSSPYDIITIFCRDARPLPLWSELHTLGRCGYNSISCCPRSCVVCTVHPVEKIFYFFVLFIRTLYSLPMILRSASIMLVPLTPTLIPKFDSFFLPPPSPTVDAECIKVKDKWIRSSATRGEINWHFGCALLLVYTTQVLVVPITSCLGVIDQREEKSKSWRTSFLFLKCLVSGCRLIRRILRSPPSLSLSLEISCRCPLPINPE